MPPPAVIPILDAAGNFVCQETSWSYALCLSKCKTIVIVGAQSTGKSSLCNDTFETDFGIQDRRSFGKTTQGAQASLISPSLDNDILVVDIEGVGGVDNEEGMDTKLMTFALTVADVVVFNLRRAAIGCPQGNGSDTLKRAFEADLKLRRERPRDTRKTIILFAIRDAEHDDQLEVIRTAVSEMCQKMWEESIKKEFEDHLFEHFYQLQVQTFVSKKENKSLYEDQVSRFSQTCLEPDSEQYVFKDCFSRNIAVKEVWADMKTVWARVSERPVVQEATLHDQPSETSHHSQLQRVRGIMTSAAEMVKNNIITLETFGYLIKILQTTLMEYYNSIADVYPTKAIGKYKDDLCAFADSLIEQAGGLSMISSLNSEDVTNAAMVIGLLAGAGLLAYGAYSMIGQVTQACPALSPLITPVDSFSLCGRDNTLGRLIAVAEKMQGVASTALGLALISLIMGSNLKTSHKYQRVSL